MDGAYGKLGKTANGRSRLVYDPLVFSPESSISFLLYRYIAVFYYVNYEFKTIFASLVFKSKIFR